MTRTKQQQESTPPAVYRGPSWSAADERVTPRELADAVAAVERRRQMLRESARHDGRIAIGDAVEQLGLDATPAELLAEVEGRRRADALRRHAQAQRRRRVRWGAAVLASGALWVGGVVGAAQFQHRPAPSNAAALDPARIVVTEQTAAGPVVKTLAEVPEGVPAQARPSAVASLLGPSAARWAAVEWHEQQPWTLVRRAGRVYLRGHLQHPATDAALAAGPVTLLSRPWRYATPGGESAVDLPLGTFRVADAGSAEWGSVNTLVVAGAADIHRPAPVDKRAGAE